MNKIQKSYRALRRGLKVVTLGMETVSRVQNVVEGVKGMRNIALDVGAVSVRVSAESEYYPLTKAWIHENMHTSFIKVNRYKLGNSIYLDDDGDDEANKDADLICEDDGQHTRAMKIEKAAGNFELDIGTYYIQPEGWPKMVVDVIEEAKTKTTKNGRTQTSSMNIVEKVIVIRFLTRNQKVCTNFQKMIADRYKSMRRTQSGLYRWKGYYWNRDVSYNRKRSDNVVMDPTVKAQLFNNLRAFMKEETADKFARECIPYRKGILLYGVPGTGKTSLAAAIANELDIDMYSINMSICTDDERLFSALDELPKGNTKKFRVILLEDVDAVGRAAKTRDEDEDNDGQGVTQAGFLNFLDGVSTPDRVLFIMTTNHPDRLDPAVIRDGRCDVRLEVKALTPELQAVMIQRFFDDMDILSAFAKFDMSLFKDQVGASVQAKIVHCHEKNMTDPKDIVQFIMVDGKIGSDDDFSMFGKSLVEEVVETEDKEEGE